MEHAQLTAPVLAQAPSIQERVVGHPGNQGAVPQRPFDIALAGLGLVLSAPLWAVASLAIKLEDGGPVFSGRSVGLGSGRYVCISSVPWYQTRIQRG